MDAFDRQDSFVKNGLVIVRGALSLKEVDEAREYLHGIFAEPALKQRANLLASAITRHEPIYRHYFGEKVVSALRSIIGDDLAYIQDFNVQRNCFGMKWAGKRPVPGSGWHIDAGSEVPNEYLYQPDYRFAKCGIFLQDHDNGWGGGIKIIPGSHRLFTARSGASRFMAKADQAVRMRLLSRGLPCGAVSVPARAGDLLVFDSRLLHSSAEPSPENCAEVEMRAGFLLEGVPLDRTKYVIYWNSCRAGMIEDHIRNSVRLGRQEHLLPDGTITPYSDYLALHYPNDFPDSFRQRAEARGVLISTLPAHSANEFKTRLAGIAMSS